MARLFGKREGAWIDVPEENVQEAFLSGNYAFAAGAQVNIQMPDGRYGTMPVEHAIDAFRSGATYDRADERQERLESAEYDERNLEAGALAVARGLSFGLSDIAAEKLGGYSEEELAKLEKYNENISMVGEIAGAVAPALLTGGTGALATAAKFTVAGRSAKLGLAAEKAVASALGAEKATKTASKMIHGGAALSAAAGVEGVLFGALDGFSEKMIGRTDKTAEQVMMDAGGIGFLSAGIGSLIGVAPPAVAKGLGVMWDTKVGKAVSSRARDWEASIVSAMHGGDERLYRKLMDPEYAHTVVFKTKEKVAETTDAFASHVDEMLEGAVEATKAVSGDKKKNLMLGLVKSDSPFEAVDAVVRNLHQMRMQVRAAAKEELVDVNKAAFQQIDRAINKEMQAILDIMGAGGGGGKNTAIGKYASKIRTAFNKDGSMDVFSAEHLHGLNRLADKPMADALLGQVFNSADQLKREIGNRIYRKGGSDIGASLSDKMGPAYHNIKHLLEDGKLFGADAASAQKGVNEAFSRLIPVKHAFERTFSKTIGSKKSAKWASVRSIAKNIDDLQGGNKDKFDLLMGFTDEYANFLRVAEKTHGQTAKLKPLLKNVSGLEKRWRELSDILAADKQIRSSYSPLTTLLSMAPVGGLVTGGPLGYLGGRVAGAMMSPAAGVRRRAMIHNAKSRVSASMDKRATKVIDRISKSMAPGGPQKARAMPVLLALVGVKSTKDDRKDARLVMENIGQLADPQVLGSKIEESTKGLEEAPLLKAEITNNIVNQVMYLASNSGSNSSVSVDPITGESEYQVSDSEVSKFISLAEIAVGGTDAVADRVINGSLTRVEADTYRALYPIQHQEFVEKVQAGLAEKGNKISYSDKIILSKLVGAPMTTTLNPMFVGAMQNIHKTLQQRAGGSKNSNALKSQVSRGRLPSERAMMG